MPGHDNCDGANRQLSGQADPHRGRIYAWRWADITARFIAQKLAESWPQSVVVDNRPGAGGTIAAQLVAHANPDGYTLLSVSSAHAVAPAIYAKLPYDPRKDFAGITLTARSKYLLVVAPALGVKSLADLIALAKARPGQLNFPSAGVGSGTHFAGEQFKSMAALNVVHVPFKGIPEALTETMSRRVNSPWRRSRMRSIS